MKRHLLASTIALLALSGCGKSGGDADVGNNSAAMVEVTGTPATVGANGPSAISTPNFVKDAATSDMFEIASAKLALQKSQSNALKVFANMMIKDHSASSAKLKGLVPAGATLPTALDDRHQTMLATLQKDDADKFDKDYTDQQTQAHREALGLIESYIAHGDDAGLKGFATDLKPKIQMHLDTISKLDHGGADEVKGDVTQNTSG